MRATPIWVSCCATGLKALGAKPCLPSPRPTASGSPGQSPERQGVPALHVCSSIWAAGGDASSRERWLFWWSGRCWGPPRLLHRAARKQAVGPLPQGLRPLHVPPARGRKPGRGRAPPSGVRAGDPPAEREDTALPQLVHGAQWEPFLESPTAPRASQKQAHGVQNDGLQGPACIFQDADI